MSKPLSKEKRGQAWNDLRETLAGATREEDPQLYDGLQSLLATVTDFERQLDCESTSGQLCRHPTKPCLLHSRIQLAEAQRWIAAKCTITGCWKSKYEGAQGKLDAVREQAAYGFTGETLANMNGGMSGKEMNMWWMKRLDRILSKEETK